MESITCTQAFEGSASAMLMRCRTLESRQCWPGVTVDADIPGTLFYTITIRLKSAAMTDMQVEERLGDNQEEGDCLWFESFHRCTWPDIVVDAKSEYRVRSGDSNAIEFTYSYDNPGPKIVKAKDLPQFRKALERVIGRYLEDLVGRSLRLV